MTKGLEQFYGAIHDAKAENLTPTHWTVGPWAMRQVMTRVRFGDYTSSLDPEKPFELLGMPVHVERDLPEALVILAASQKEVAAFTIHTKERDR